MRIVILTGLRPFNPKAAGRDLIAGVTLASMNIPQVLGYARIAGMPVVTGLYTVLLPIIAFAVFGSSAPSCRGRRFRNRAVMSFPVRLEVAWRRRPARNTWLSSAWSH